MDLWAQLMLCIDLIAYTIAGSVIGKWLCTILN